MSDTSRVQVRYVEESVYGTTPAVALKNLRATGHSLKPIVETRESAELRPDGNVVDLYRVATRGEGGIEFEFSYGTFDDLLTGALRSAWQTGVPALGSDQLENGTTKRFFTFEVEHADIAQFVTYTGMVIDTFSLSMKPGEVITGSMALVGKIASLAGVTAGTGAATAANTNTPINAADQITALTEGGSSIDLMSLDLSIANGARLQPKLGSLGPKGAGLGRFLVNGSLEAYFENATHLNKFLNFTSSSLNVTVLDAGGNEYQVKLPKIRYKAADIPTPGNDQDQILKLEFQGLYDATADSTLAIVRNPAG